MWADWIEAVLTRAGFRVLPRSTVMTAAAGDGAVRGSIQAERELQVAPRAIAVLSSAYLPFTRRPHHLENALGRPTPPTPTAS